MWLSADRGDRRYTGFLKLVSSPTRAFLSFCTNLGRVSLQIYYEEEIYMKRLWVYAQLIAILLAALAGGIVMGDPGRDDAGNSNDPTVNERANACYEGGSMAGKCLDDEVLWIAGWYRIRFDYGLLSLENIPDWLAWVLPPDSAPSTCTIDIGINAPGMQLSRIINIPLAVINGSVDPNEGPGTPYGLDWYTTTDGFGPFIRTETSLRLHSANPNLAMALWTTTDNGSFWDSNIVFNTCPTPTPPILN
jgi:hypothetical protein